MHSISDKHSDAKTEKVTKNQIDQVEFELGTCIES